MTIFNELLNNNNYPSLKIMLKNGKEKTIKNVHFYSVHRTIDGAERVRVWTGKKEPIDLENVEYITNVNV